MAVPVVASSDPQNTSGDTQLTFTKPASTAEGDFLLVHLAVDGDAQNVTAPADAVAWTKHHEGTSANMDGLIFYKVAGASEPASYQFTWSSTDSASGQIVRITGADTTTPVNAQAWNDNGGSASTTHECPTVTTTVADCLLMRLIEHDTTTTITTPYPATTLEYNYGSVNGTVGLSYQTKATAGATGTADWTTTGSERSYTTTMCIAPAAASIVPTSFTATDDAANAEVDFTWTAGAGDDGATYRKQILQKAPGAAIFLDKGIFAKSATSASIPRPPAGALYTWRVALLDATDAIVAISNTDTLSLPALPGAGALVAAGLAPTITNATSAMPGVGTMTLAGLQPVVDLGAGAVTLAPGTGSVSLSGLMPTLDGQESTTFISARTRCYGAV